MEVLLPRKGQREVINSDGAFLVDDKIICGEANTLRSLKWGNGFEEVGGELTPCSNIEKRNVVLDQTGLRTRTEEDSSSLELEKKNLDPSNQFGVHLWYLVTAPALGGRPADSFSFPKTMTDLHRYLGQLGVGEEKWQQKHEWILEFTMGLGWRILCIESDALCFSSQNNSVPSLPNGLSMDISWYEEHSWC